MEVQGKIILLGETELVTDKFQKRQIVIETEDKYPQKISLEFVNANADKLDGYKVGDNVEISFNLRGSEYKDKFYVNLTGWKIAKVEASPQYSTAGTAGSDAEDDQDLPF